MRVPAGMGFDCGDNGELCGETSPSPSPGLSSYEMMGIGAAALALLFIALGGSSKKKTGYVASRPRNYRRRNP